MASARRRARTGGFTCGEGKAALDEVGDESTVVILARLIFDVRMTGTNGQVDVLICRWPSTSAMLH
jgi:hypothetical protein